MRTPPGSRRVDVFAVACLPPSHAICVTVRFAGRRSVDACACGLDCLAPFRCDSSCGPFERRRDDPARAWFGPDRPVEWQESPYTRVGAVDARVEKTPEVELI